MSERLVVGTRKGLFIFERHGEGWKIESTSFVGDAVSMVLPDSRDGSIYAALDLGHFGVKIRRSGDGGESWDEVGIPQYEKLAGAEETGPAVKLLWTLASAGADRDGSLWVGTIPGGLFRSDDHGESWKLNRALWDRPEREKWSGGGYDEPGIHSICVDPNDSRQIAVGVSCGGFWLSEDEGETWRVSTKGMFAEYMPPERREDPAIQDPHCIVQCSSAPSFYWTQHHNGIFRSVDGGSSWEAVHAQPSSFGFATAVHPKDPETGDRLAMGSTTGSLWFTED